MSMVHLPETKQTVTRMSKANGLKENSPVVISFMDFVNSDIIVPKKSNPLVNNDLHHIQPNRTKTKHKQFFAQTGKRKHSTTTDSNTASKRKKSNDGDVVCIDDNVAPKTAKTKKPQPKSLPEQNTVSKKTKKTAKTKHRRLSSDVIEIKVIKPPQIQKNVVTKKPSANTDTVSCEVPQEETPLWAEKHKPKSPVDLLVNQSTVLKLQKWLKEWKEVIEKESVSLRKQAERQQNKKKKKSSGSSSDSDFRLSDEDSRGHGLCNTFVLVGPTGCGKTVTAYTCANELGFKVLEINASCQRSYKQVMAQLQEATQSHLILKQSNKETTAPKTNLVKTATCKGMESLFKKQTQKSTPLSIPSAKDQNSLILFDEVEAILENDRGFWSAVQSFSSISKRPILLTTTKKSALQNLTGNYIASYVSAASKKKLCSLLHDVASNEGSTLDVLDCDDAVSSMKCDIRHSVMSLHFWTQIPQEKSKPTKTKRRSQSNSTLPKVPSPVKLSIDRFTSKCWGVEDILKSSKNLADILSPIEQDSLQSVEDSVAHMIQNNLPDVIFQSRFSLTGAQVAENVNQPLTIHVPKDSSPVSWEDNFNQSHPDIDTDFLSLAYNRPLMPSYGSTTFAYGFNDDSTASIISNGNPTSLVPSGNEQNLPIASSSFSNALLHDLSKYFDNVSLCDRLSYSYTKTYPFASKYSGHIQLFDGLSDDIVTKVSDPPAAVASIFADCQASLRVRNLRRIQCKIQHQPLDMKSLEDVGDFRTRYSDSLFDRLSYCNDSKASQKLCRSLHLDYLPALRFVCRTEERRKAAKASRRFFHYLDQIQLFPSPGDVSKLTSEFVEKVIDEKS
uniref:Uncharacterized protein LOC100176493 n=1 Tax=Phallusia mammillata TaxID=59560 RepID=A0A6F9DH56_9ASCI|nr:uncharacterized protein LOC100176493 [Phallusia mammillata]